MPPDAADPVHAAAPEFLRSIGPVLRLLLLLFAPLFRLSVPRTSPPRPPLICDAPALPRRRATTRSRLSHRPARPDRAGGHRSAGPRARPPIHTPATGPPAPRARAPAFHA
jgi:hypothetical protein